MVAVVGDQEAFKRGGVEVKIDLSQEWGAERGPTPVSRTARSPAPLP